MTLIRIEDGTLPYEFEGEKFAGSDTRRDHRGQLRPRWLELALYRTPDGEWIFHKVNYSNVWHLASGIGHVKKPQKLQAADLIPEAVYCGTLPPPRHDRGQCPPIGRRTVSPETVVIAELPQQSVARCPDHQEVINRVITATRRGTGVVTAVESVPARELLARAAEKDPRFRGLAVRI